MPHIHEKIDFTVEVLVVNKNAVLLRMHDKYKLWLGVGGHIELDEDPTEAAIREVKEEVGLDVTLIGTVPVTKGISGYTELLAPRFLNRHRISETHEHITLTYFATSETRQIKQGQQEVSQAIRWFTVEELTDSHYGVSDRMQYYALSALRSI